MKNYILIDWNDMYDHSSGKFTLYKLRPVVDGSLEVNISIEISRDMKWTVFIAGLRVLGARIFLL